MEILTVCTLSASACRRAPDGLSPWQLTNFKDCNAWLRYLIYDNMNAEIRPAESEVLRLLAPLLAYRTLT